MWLEEQWKTVAWYNKVRTLIFKGLYSRRSAQYAGLGHYITLYSSYTNDLPSWHTNHNTVMLDRQRLALHSLSSVM